MRNLKKKSALWICVVTLLLFGMVIAQASAQQTVVSVNPEKSTVAVKDTFTIKINIANVINLSAYEFILLYDTTILDGLHVKFPAGHFLTTDPTKIFVAKNVTKDDYNATHGYVWFAVTLLPPEPKSGSGTLVTVTFKVTASGKSVLRLDLSPVDPGYLYPVKLSDPKGNPIPCTAVDGEVEVTTSAQPSTPFPIENIVVVIVILIAIFSVAVYYTRKRILK